MKNILVNMGVRYDKVALIDDSKLIDFYCDDHQQKSTVDGIYFGIVKDSVRKYDSVFIDIGLDKNAYLQGDNTDKLPLCGEKVMVQVIREDTDTKGVAVSKNITLVGRYIVLLVNNSKKNTPKSKIMFSNDFNTSLADNYRKDLKNVIKDTEDNVSIIVRHEAENIDIILLEEDIKNLLDTYNNLMKEYEHFASDKKIKDVGLRYQKDISDIVINEFYDRDTNKIICDKESTAKLIREKMDKYHMNSKIVEVYDKDSKLTMFESYKVDEELKKALGRYAWLKSGGQIIIEHTEALTVIDVNSGKCEGKKDIEASSFKVNMEAAKEIARQIRLRNISGIIVVDFINMKSEENKKELLKALKEYVKEDKIKTNVVGITNLGLVEMTRQKKRKMLKDIIK
ncbi:MAG: ribonuclease E/G [Clostridia bacterium]|nr:ribonuclease E/G [Clostridia bacterium]